jgi:hypothetical protein
MRCALVRSGCRPIIQVAAAEVPNNKYIDDSTTFEIPLHENAVKTYVMFL